MRRPLAILLAALTALALAPAAAMGVTRVVQDLRGRPMTFDLRAPEVDVAGYARILRRAVHGDEIRSVVFRVVPRRAITASCGSGDAIACYRANGFGDGLIVLPATDPSDVEHALLHEYAHHIDRHRDHRGLPEPNGSALWWAARKMSSRLRAGEVAHDYALGWTHAIGEIFAEDYVQLHVQAHHGIGWLSPPSAGVLAALRLDLTGRATGPAPRRVTPPSIPPPGPQTPVPTPSDPGLVLERQGTIEQGELRVLPFRLLGPGRRAQVRALASGAGTARVEVICDGRVLATAEIGDDRPASFDRPGLGPASCELQLTGTGGTVDFDLTLTLSIGGGGGLLTAGRAQQPRPPDARVAGRDVVQAGERVTYVLSGFGAGQVVDVSLTPVTARGGNCCFVRLGRGRADAAGRLVLRARMPRSYRFCLGPDPDSCRTVAWRDGEGAVLFASGGPRSARMVVAVLVGG